MRRTRQRFTCALGTIASGVPVSATLELTATATGAQLVSGVVGSDDPDPTPADNDADVTLTVTAAPSGQTGPTGSATVAPADLTPPSISGTPLPGDTLTCRPGTWSGEPSTYSYVWLRDGQPISGATGPTYMVTIGDSASPLTCEVTATGPGGTSAPAKSASVIVGTPSAFKCPQPTGHLGGLHVGPLAIGMTKSKARHTLPRSGTAGYGFDRFCLYAGFGIRAGYASAKLLSELGHRLAHAVAGRIVIALTANPFYSVHGIAPGATLAAAARSLHFGKPFHIGLNDWYLGPAGKTAVLAKVRHGIVLELGLADGRLTATRTSDRRLLTSFPKLS